jgi:hypothetical protein
MHVVSRGFALQCIGHERRFKSEDRLCELGRIVGGAGVSQAYPIGPSFEASKGLRSAVPRPSLQHFKICAPCIAISYGLRAPATLPITASRQGGRPQERRKPGRQKAARFLSGEPTKTGRTRGRVRVVACPGNCSLPKSAGSPPAGPDQERGP